MAEIFALFLSIVMLFTGLSGKAVTSLGERKEAFPTAGKSFSDSAAPEKDGENMNVTFRTKDAGYDIYAPFRNYGGYRYGPSILYYEDGSADAWFATNGQRGEWDWFTYKHFDGEMWSDEKVVLRPTADSMDHYSVCDPGVIYFGGYYYIGYTSTIVSTNGGINNNVFVARSENPDGPFEKWNGNGWGGDPAPIIYFDENAAMWGAGEPSFVVVDGVLYFYYSWLGSGAGNELVATADTSENWPASLTPRGTVATKENSQDSWDVIYIEEIGKFVGFCTYERFTDTSGVAVYQSDDGIHFEKSDVIRTGICSKCHNMGISKRPDGHVRLTDNLFIGYAYQTSTGGWGDWSTRFQPIELVTYEGKIRSIDNGGAPTPTESERVKKPTAPVVTGITTDKAEIDVNLNQYKKIKMFWFDKALEKHTLASSAVSFDGYDESIIKIENRKITPVAVGSTLVTVTYADFTYTFKVTVHEKGYSPNDGKGEIESFRAVSNNITVSLDDWRHTQIRGFVTFRNGDWGEAYNDYGSSRENYPPMIDADIYHMTFDVENGSIISVDDSGIITPLTAGTTTVTVTMTGGFTDTVTVTVE